MTQLSAPVREAGCASAAQLEFIAAGDAVPPAVSAHVTGCVSCGAYVTALTQAHLAFNAAQPAELMARKVARRAEAAAGTRRRWWAVAFAVLAASVLAVVLVSRDAPSEGVGLKAGSGLSIYATPSPSIAPRPLGSGAHVSSGELLHFQFSPSASGYLMILDLDGGDQLTVFHPYQGRSAVPVIAGEPHRVTETIQLDSSPGPDRIVAVFRKTPFTLSDVEAWVKAGRGKAAIPTLACADCTAEWMVLEKP